MFFSPTFIFVHMPKNAGSFVESVLRKVYGRADSRAKFYDRAIAPLVAKVENREPICFHTIPLQTRLRGYGEVLVHGHCSSIPTRYSQTPILAVLRDPFDRYISEYEFKWWAWAGRKHTMHDRIISKYPGWPSTQTFAEEVELRHEFHTLWQINLPVEKRVGIQTEHFVRFFCHEPRKLLSLGNALTVRQVLDSLYPIHFLQMHSLNVQLADYLKIQGCSKEQTDLAETHEKVLPGGRGRQRHGDIDRYFPADLHAKTEVREQILLAILREIQAGNNTKAKLQAALC